MEMTSQIAAPVIGPRSFYTHLALSVKPDTRPTTIVRRTTSAGSVEGDDTHGVELDSYFGGDHALLFQLRL